MTPRTTLPSIPVNTLSIDELDSHLSELITRIDSLNVGSDDDAHSMIVNSIDHLRLVSGSLTVLARAYYHARLADLAARRALHLKLTGGV